MLVECYCKYTNTQDKHGPHRQHQNILQSDCSNDEVDGIDQYEIMRDCSKVDGKEHHMTEANIKNQDGIRNAKDEVIQ